MKAILVRQSGGPEQLHLGEHPCPEPASDELLVRVRATALNRADILQRQGRYPPPPGASSILGLEMAGTVEKVGAACEGWRVGERVFGLLPGGGYAEYAVLPAAMAMRVPANLSFEEAAAVPEVFLTAFQCLFWLGELRPGERVLIHAGASGVGTAAIQLVREAGATSLVTAGSAAKLAACRELGAAAGFDYEEGPFAPRVLEATDGRGVDLILDFVGAPYWDQNLECLALDGRLVLIATMGGSTVERLDLRALMKKRLRIAATTLRPRSPEYKARLTRELAEFALPRFAEGRLRAVVDSVHPWERVADAHRRMEANLNVGKIVLRVAS